MESLLVCLMEGLSGEIKELKESFKELKAENAVLRKEILGIGSSAESSAEKGMGLMEKTTLRELVEQIQFDVKALNAKVERSLREEERSGNGNKSYGENRGEPDLSSAYKGVQHTDDPGERFPVVDIKLKTLADEREWMKKNYAESFKQRSTITEGASFRGRTLQTISSSTVPNPILNSTSCTIKLSNHLSYALTDPRFHFWHGNKTSGPSKVDPHVSEVFTFQGETNESYCQFLCSFGISSSLRLTSYAFTSYFGSIEFGMAFTPQDVPTDSSLCDKFLMKTSSVPDIWMHTPPVKEPLEVLINRGKLLARGHMTPGPFSVFHIDIMEVSDTETAPFPVNAKMKPLENGESISATLTSTNFLQGSTFNQISCNIEIRNCLNYTLKSRSAYFCNSAQNNFFPSEIRPFYREKFLASDNKTLEASFSYKIESTDLCLVVALRVESGNNSFAVAFDQVPVQANRDKLVALMDPEAWKTHLYKKYAHAKYGEQVIEIRNIRVSVKMTEDEQSLLKIRIFAVK